jgi:hypothetical protein
MPARRQPEQRRDHQGRGRSVVNEKLPGRVRWHESLQALARSPHCLPQSLQAGIKVIAEGVESIAGGLGGKR